MRKLFGFLDDNIVSILAGFLLIFIPLYPKIPLFDILPGYIVRVRIEDILVSLTILFWIIWLIRGKLALGPNPLLKITIVYLIIGILSMISAVFLLQTVPLQTIHVGKMVLHFIRRIEYFSLFFIFYSTVKSLKQVKIYIALLVVTILAVTLYGYGQKYLYWPAFSTMNREFSKGWVLYLTAHARVLSTFGGHYDLAAFTMMLLTLLWSIFFALKSRLAKIGIFLITAGAFWLLILTASRTSFLAYLAGVAAISFFWAFRKGIRFSLLAWVIITALSIIVMLSFGDLSERFTKLLKLNERLGGIKSLVLTPLGVAPPGNVAFLENNPQGIGAVTSSSDQPPTPNRPVDVEKEIPLMVPTSTGSATVSAVPRTYSQNALVYDLSTGIRLDSLWPKAIKGFLRNPILGSGYSTLTKDQPTEFTEAESTDNDYLRSLGETGLLGALAFYGILSTIMVIIWRSFTGVKDPLFYSLLVGLVGVIVGLLVNAVYIDVFEASKVAFSFWAIAGIALGGIKAIHGDIEKNKLPPNLRDYRIVKHQFSRGLAGFFRSDFFILLFILLLAFIVRLYKIDTPLADWHSWRQADTSSVTRHYVGGGINLLYPTYDDLSSVASGKDNPQGLRFVEFPLYNVLAVIVDKIFVGWNIEISQRLATIFLSLVSIIFLYKLVKMYEGKVVAILASFFFALLPYNIYYSRVILPEPLLVATSLGLLYCFARWLERERLRYILFAILFGSLSFLVKPYAAFMLIPIFYLAFNKWGKTSITKSSLIILLAFCFGPFLIWRWWESHFPQGIPAYTWLFNGDGIRFKGAFFYWLFADRLGRLILGYWGLPLLLLGILGKPKKGNLIFHFYALGAVAYLSVIATGNVRHDYYQIFIIPVVVIFLAKGVITLIELGHQLISPKAAIVMSLIMIIALEGFAWYHVKDYYNINHPEIVEAGQDVQRLTSEKSLVIAPYDGDTAFLYQTWRRGWPVMEGSIDEMIKKGADYYVSVRFDGLTQQLLQETVDKGYVGARFKLIKSTDKYIIIQLVPDNELPKD